MPNTLSGLIPAIFEGLDIIAREMVGLIPAVTRNSSAERAAVGQTITYPIVPVATVGTIVPAQFPVWDGTQTIGHGEMVLDKARYSPILWEGEEEKGVGHSGELANIKRDQFVQSMRALVNQIEADIAAAVRVGASRATGLIGTAPFGTVGNFLDFANALQVLDENGAPESDRHLVLGTAAVRNLRGVQSSLWKANEAGSDDMLRNGRLARIEGFDIHRSSVIGTVASGTGAGYTTTAAGFAVGTTAIPIITGAGTILPGDTITFTGDSNVYVVAAGVAAPGTITLAAPGLRLAIAAAATALTVGAVHTGNPFFHRSAVQLVTRAPAQPAGGDAAVDILTITDSVSGLSFEICKYAGYKSVKFEVGIVYGVEVNKPEFVGLLLG